MVKSKRQKNFCNCKTYLSDRDFADILAHFHDIATLGETQLITLVRAFHLHAHHPDSCHIVDLHDFTLGTRHTEDGRGIDDGDTLDTIIDNLNTLTRCRRYGAYLHQDTCKNRGKYSFYHMLTELQ